MEAALECKKNGESKTILFNLCGHGHFDMQAYSDYLDNNLAEDVFEEENINKALADLPNVAQFEILYVIIYNFFYLLSYIILSMGEFH